MDREMLGRQLRSLRAARGLSLAQLAEATGISPSFLSLVESGKSDITISRLVRLADYFEVELADLVRSRTTRHPLEVFEVGAGSLIASPSEGVEVRLLGQSHWGLSPCMVEYAPGGGVEVSAVRSDAGEALMHWEMFAHVLRGTFELTIGEQPPARLSRGESALFRGGPHRFENVGKGAGEVLFVGSSARGGGVARRPRRS
jgi:transcriptional regulator with XRE-family HTH domain